MPTSSPLGFASRRSFLRLGLPAATLPLLSEGHLAWAALQVARGRHPLLRDAAAAAPVMINANENPLGPSAHALAAINASARTGGRYDADGGLNRLREQIAAQTGLKADHIAIYAGSSEPLHYSVLAFTSPSAPFVTADPSYEAGMRAAEAAGAPVVKVALTPTYAHDVKAMVAAAPNAGLLYICNPNNPTGTLTPREDIVWTEANKPKGTVLLVDEAYIHFADVPSSLNLVAQGKDVIFLRTFSKIYGMAGIRCGVALGRPDLLAKLQRYGMNPMPVTAVAAASASLDDPTLVDSRRRINTDIRNATFAWLDTKGWHYTPAVSNCFMIDTGRSGKVVIQAMRERNVFIGRTWPVWPNFVRVTVGTSAEMQTFQTAFDGVMGSMGNRSNG